MWWSQPMSAPSPHPLPPHPSLRLHHSSWWGTEAPPYPHEREDEEEDDAEGWGPKPELSVRWQKLSNTTIAISHSPSLSDYTDHYTAAVCVGVCLCGEGGFWRGLCWWWRRGIWLWFYTFTQSSRLLSLCLHNRRLSEQEDNVRHPDSYSQLVLDESGGQVCSRSGLEQRLSNLLQNKYLLFSLFHHFTSIHFNFGISSQLEVSL